MTLTGKRSSVQEDSDDEKIVKPSKKRRVLESDDDSEDDSENTDTNSSRVLQKEVKATPKRSLPLDNKIQTPKAKIAKKTPAKGKAEDDEAVGEKESLLMVDNLSKVWLHEKLDFLKPTQIRDKNKRRPKDPDYDPRTVFVPQEFMKDLTPGKARQLRSDHPLKVA